MNCHAKRVERVWLAGAVTKREQAPRTPNASRGSAAAVVRGVLFLGLGFTSLGLHAAETWQAALSRMPLGTNVRQLNRTNCVGLLLGAFQSNDIVKALIFMPGATDELYFWRRANAELTNSPASLLDAVNALTNQTFIRAAFRPPLLLLHTSEDLVEPVITVQWQPTADKIKRGRFAPHVLYNDRDWDYLWPVLRKAFRTDLEPWPHLTDSWHFYRHSFAAWNLTAWEALEATALAGEEVVTVRRRQVVFEGDTRPRVVPKLDAFPR